MAKEPKKSRKEARLYGKGAVRYQLPEGFNGPIQIKVDFRQAPPPPSYFYADSVGMAMNSDLLMATLSFGQQRTGGPERVDVVIPRQALLQVFWQSARGIERTVGEAISALGAKVAESLVPETRPSVTLYANMVYMAVGPNEASLDFYCIAPGDIHFARTQGAEIGLQPIVRILMSIVLAKTFFNLLRPQAERLAAASDRMGRQVGRGTG